MGLFDRLFGRRDERDTIGVEEYFASPDVWVPVTSSNVHSIAYYGMGSVGQLRVKFDPKKAKVRRIRTWKYDGVPYSVWAGFLDAPSKGTYVHESVKQYNGVEVT